MMRMVRTHQVLVEAGRGMDFTPVGEMRRRTGFLVWFLPIFHLCRIRQTIRVLVIIITSITRMEWTTN